MREIPVRPLLAGFTTVLALSLVPLAQTSSPAAGDPELGKRIYRQALLPSGKPLRATLQGIPVVGQQLACASCHRRSGFGSSEGSVLVPPLTAPALFQERQPDRADLFRKLYQEVQSKPLAARVRDPRIRPAYNEATLSAAIRQGRDPCGRLLDEAMPRFELGASEMAHLSAYLRTLSAAPDPGVDESRIHFATVLTEGVPEDRRRAVLDVMQAYLRFRNTETRGEQLRRGHSPWHRDDFYSALRYWELHVWELKGVAEDWPSQLEAFYRQQPVFALLGGLGDGPWRPVHEFCEANQIPCLFPNTAMPVTSKVGDYSLYLSPGLGLEARALAVHLAETGGDTALPIQVYRDTPSGRTLAQALDGALRERGIKGLQGVVVDRSPLSRSFWSELLAKRPSQLVLWLGADDLRELTSPDIAAQLPAVYLSYSLLGDPAHLPEFSPGSEVYLTYPYALAGQEAPRIYRVRAWLRSRRVARTHERLQLNTYFALSVADYSLGHLVENFSRDYFIETVEHETENQLSPGVYPHLSLGPGQRFASKGCYIVRLSGQALEPVSSWIVP